MIPLVVPVKAFSQAKFRLSPRLGQAGRYELARQMATAVVRAGGHNEMAGEAPFEIFVACDDQEVAAWAEEMGAKIIWCEGLDLNGSVTRAAQTLLKTGANEMVVAHSDLPHSKSFLSVLGDTQITIVPDRHRLGTNVLRVPLAQVFIFQYGVNSFQLHQKEAKRLGLTIAILEDEDLMLDVDLPADLDLIKAEIIN